MEPLYETYMEPFDETYMEPFDVSSKTVGFALELGDGVVLGFDDVVQQGHLGLDGIDTIAKALILLGQDHHLPRPFHGPFHGPLHGPLHGPFDRTMNMEKGPWKFQQPIVNDVYTNLASVLITTTAIARCFGTV